MTIAIRRWDRPLRLALLDKDGTMAGFDGSFRHDIDGQRNGGAVVRALDLLEENGTESMLMTAADGARAAAEARALGLSSSFVYELGCAVVIDGERKVLTTNPWRPTSDVTVLERMRKHGVPEVLFEHFRGRLEWHQP